jgi:hypothetical protein
VTGVTRVQNDIKVDPTEDKSVADRMKSGLSKTGEKITDRWDSRRRCIGSSWAKTRSRARTSRGTKDNVVTLKGT